MEPVAADLSLGRLRLFQARHQPAGYRTLAELRGQPWRSAVGHATSLNALHTLSGRLAPDFKTIADFRRDDGAGIRNVCRRFIELCRDLKPFSEALVVALEPQVDGGNSCNRYAPTPPRAYPDHQIERC